MHLKFLSSDLISLSCLSLLSDISKGPNAQLRICSEDGEAIFLEASIPNTGNPKPSISPKAKESRLRGEKDPFSFPEPPYEEPRNEQHETSLCLYFSKSSLIPTFEGTRQGMGRGRAAPAAAGPKR